MKRFIEGVDRIQSTLFPDRLEGWIGDDNAVRVLMSLSMSLISVASALAEFNRFRPDGRLSYTRSL